MRLVTVLLLTLLSLASFAQNASDKDQRMEWWRKARFGMFIHFGLYAIPAGKWGNNTNYAEWIRNEAHIPVKEYEKFQKEFDPSKFDADNIVKIAKDAGMQYVVITTKHHDGFCLFNSKYTTWDVTHTPYHKDIMAQMAAACKKEGLKMCWYHSIMDWHHPDYLPRREWEVKDRPVDGAEFSRYVQYLHNQVTELLTHYGPIGVMWFDGQWEPTWTEKEGKALYALCRKLQPNVIVNNRVSVDGSTVGDFITPEQYIPATGLPNTDWETCMTMNDHWGYNAYDHDWKSSKMLIRNIIDTASKGGNYLLNIGPKADGTFPQEAIDRLHDIGTWMKANGDSIYDTKASVFEDLPWGRCTTRTNGSTTTLFLHVFDWPSDGQLRVPGLGNQPDGAKILGSGAAVTCRRDGPDVIIDLSGVTQDPISSTVALTIEGTPIIYKTPKIKTPADVLVNHASVSLEGGEGQELRYTTDGSEPDANSTLYAARFEVSDTTTIKAAAFHKGQKVSTTAVKTIEKVAPDPAVEVNGLQPGLHCDEFHGKWETMPDFAQMAPSKSFDSDHLAVAEKNGVPEEYVGRRYTGYIDAPADDVYEFALSSDDGSRLYIDGNMVIDNDGLHSSLEKSGTAALAQGKHKIEVQWYNHSGGAELKLRWAAAGQDLTELKGAFH